MATQEKSKSMAATSFLAQCTGIGFWGIAELLWQFSGGHAERGRLFVTAFLFLLLLGGTVLLVRGVRDLFRYRKESKSTTDTDRKKAA